MIQARFVKIMDNLEGPADIDVRSALSEDGGGVLAAVSGGIDSMCMADLFWRTYGCGRFALAHCNFCLRGEESDADEQLVRGWAEERGISFHCISFDTAGYAGEHGISIEMAARELRYSWFAGLCAEHGYQAVAVAHNANDNAETLLLNLVRGTGLKGISGMSQAAVMPYSGDAQVLLLRPLLQFTRKQIEGHVFANRVPYRNDSTNAQSEYKRNSIRNEVFPLLERLNPSFVRTFNREMAYFSEAEDIVADWCASAASTVASASEGGALSVDLKKLAVHRHWRYLLYHILEPFGFNSAVLASLEDLVSSGRTVSGKSFRSASHVLFTGRGVLDVYPLDVYPLDVSGDIYPQFGRPSDSGSDEVGIRIEGPGVYDFNGVSFSVEEFDRQQDFVLKQPAGVLVMDADRMKFPFLCRKWKHGDWMVPLGMRGKKKLSDFFADSKLDTLSKERAVVMAAEDCQASAKNHVAGVLGMRADDMYRITPQTERIVRISII